MPPPPIEDQGTKGKRTIYYEVLVLWWVPFLITVIARDWEVKYPV